MAKMKTVTLTRNVLIGGKHTEIGEVVTLPEKDADYLIGMQKAVEGKQKIDKPKAEEPKKAPDKKAEGKGKAAEAE